MDETLSQHFRAPLKHTAFSTREPLSPDRGYFKVGQEVVYGQYCGRRPQQSASSALRDALEDASFENAATQLPFSLAQVTDNLRFERYSPFSNGHSPMSTVLAGMYYFVRPVLPVEVRKHLQKARLRGWERLSFPHWPVDSTVDNLFEQLLLLILRTHGLKKIPFIWFWPDGASSCAIMTHDVETRAGRDFCGALMDIDDSFSIKASFQVVPELRYEVPSSYLDSIRQRGFEVNVQDLNHDGRLFRERSEFLARAARINAYGREYQASGFRSAILYRRQDWYEALEFSYDMSVPNVAHLDPQRGGCCTVMPYFVGKILELPVTATQDYTLFHILNDYSIDLWKRQAELIMEKHGLMGFIVHPDYITASRERKVYEQLLEHLAELRSRKNVWMPLPHEVDSWWRQRSQMNLVEEGSGWGIEGPGRERARIAYAEEDNGRLVFTLAEPSRKKSAAGMYSPAAK
jgi:hypothetical protein